MNSTQDAFSLPTHSSSLPPPTTPYATRTPSSEAFDLEPPSAAAYTYPPPPRNDDSYGYLPNPAFDSSRSTNPSSILPLHHPHPHSRGHYPPLTHTWTRIRTWLTDEYPELGDTLNYGVLPEILHEVELTLGFTLPASVRESYLTTDGQEPESITGVGEGLFYGLSFLSLEDALEEWKFWRTVDDDPTTGANHRLRSAMQSIPPGFVRREYSNRGWFPLVSDKTGNYLGVDMNPDQEGSVGQVIIFGRDFDMKVVVCSGEGEGGWGKWLANFAEELEAGDAFEIGNADSSDGSDDGLGYDSYFNDGSRTRGHNSASAGLRLTGEFRGWPVLEAWGTRSYRQWVESGHMVRRSR
jgi:cell wall assembly regulator SMI1